MKVIHLLNWKLSSIKKELENVKNQGFDAIQINPMQPFKEEREFHWWLSYQPLGFRIGNMFGTKQDLKELCEEARKYDIDIIVDVVINHTANTSHNPLIPHDTVDKELLWEESFWKKSGQMINGNDRHDATTKEIGLPGLDLSNYDLQRIVFRFLKELHDCGVKGLRFDAAKHIGLPNDGVDFFVNVNEFLKKYNMYAYAEFLGGDKDWRDEMAEYLMILSPNGTTLSDIKLLFAFYESHDTFLNDFGKTRMIDTKDLIKIYKLLRCKYKNTLSYERPILYDKNPYYKNIYGYTFNDVLKLNERDYFDTYNLDNSMIRYINTHVVTIDEQFKRLSDNEQMLIDRRHFNSVIESFNNEKIKKLNLKSKNLF